MFFKLSLFSGCVHYSIFPVHCALYLFGAWCHIEGCWRWTGSHVYTQGKASERTLEANFISLRVAKGDYPKWLVVILIRHACMKTMGCTRQFRDHLVIKRNRK